jgi:phosphoglycolate phosphatase
MMPPAMLILFDIDMTLITTEGSGRRAMVSAGRAMFGPGFSAEGIPTGGRLDPLIIADMFGRAGIKPTPDRVRAFQGLYEPRLAAELSTAQCRALPGVLDLLELLEGEARGAGGLCLGVLTGNFERTGSMKLRACGIDPGRFAVRVWGDESPNSPPARADLVPVGIRRAEARLGRPVHPREVVIIGDTAHDVEAARVHGCRCIGVGTGQSSAADLAAAGADLALDDLRDAGRVVRWLLGGVQVS